MRNRKKVLYGIDLILLASFLFLDQWTKHLAVLHLKGQEPIALWDGVLELHYLENSGAAFGILQNRYLFFMLGAAVIIAIVLYALIRFPAKKRYDVLHLLGVMLAAGGIGNMIDRLRQQYVVDFIYFKLINFPIFNVADILVCVSGFALAFLYLFVCREEDVAWLKRKDRKSRD